MISVNVTMNIIEFSLLVDIIEEKMIMPDEAVKALLTDAKVAISNTLDKYEPYSYEFTKLTQLSERLNRIGK